MPISRALGNHRPPGRTEETTMHHVISYCLAQGNGGYAHVPGGRVLAKWTGR